MLRLVSNRAIDKEPPVVILRISPSQRPPCFESSECESRLQNNYCWVGARVGCFGGGREDAAAEEVGEWGSGG